MPFTRRNLKQDVEDVGSNFDGAPDLEFRLATKALELEQSGLGYQRIPPNYRFPYGHTSDGKSSTLRIGEKSPRDHPCFAETRPRWRLLHLAHGPA